CQTQTHLICSCLPEGCCSKAEFLQGCGDYWTSLEQVPALVQVTVCMEVRVLSPGPWTAFTYSSPDSPLYDLALRGDGRGLEVWLLGVKHRFPVSLKSHLWHHVCLRRDGHTLLLEVDDWAEKRAVTSRAIPPSGELLLGCKGHRDSQGGAGQLELYLFRMWEDMAEHSDCKDGGVVSWDSRKWAVAGTAKCIALLTTSINDTKNKYGYVKLSLNIKFHKD
uniref:Pentraxin n=1 Tax=Paramormyrops kingsleyae TaxID=1676925 RepID=A0A3B3Q2W5_9TELE